MKLRKRLLIPALAFLMLTVGYLFTEDASDPANRALPMSVSPVAPVTNIEKRESSSSAATGQKNEIIAQSPIEQPPLSPSDLLSKEEVLEMLAWLQERGHPSHSLDGEVETSPYEYYSPDTLQELANGGDPQAMFVLGRKQFLESGNYEQAKSRFIEASIHGYTVTFGHLGNISISKAYKAKAANSLAEAKEHQKEAYAWFEVGIMRGDKVLGVSKRMYNIDFTPEEHQEIKALANQHYSELVAKREALGLLPFDNDYPAALDIVYGEIFANDGK